MWESVKEVVIIISLDLNNNKSWRTLKSSQRLLKSSIMCVGLVVTQSPAAPPLPTDDHSSVKHESKAVATKLSSPFSFSFSLPHSFPSRSTSAFVFTQTKPRQTFKECSLRLFVQKEGQAQSGIPLIGKAGALPISTVRTCP